MSTPPSYKNSGTCRSCGATGSHKCPGLQFSPRVEEKPNPLAELSRTLEETIETYSGFMKDARLFADLKPEGVADIEEAFDQGFLAGLRRAIIIANELTSKSTKEPGN